MQINHAILNKFGVGNGHSEPVTMGGYRILESWVPGTC